MKKSIYAIGAAALVVALTSCGPKTPNEFAEKALQLEIKGMELEIQAIEKAIKDKDRHFLDNIEMETGSLAQDDKEIKVLEKEGKYARQKYEDMMFKNTKSSDHSSGYRSYKEREDSYRDRSSDQGSSDYNGGGFSNNNGEVATEEQMPSDWFD